LFHTLSINFSNSLFFSLYSLCTVVHSITANGFQLGEDGTFSTELQPKTALQIYEKLSNEAVSCRFCQTDVTGCPVVFCLDLSVCGAVGQTHSLPSLGLGVGLCDLAMCVAVKCWLFI
jgi:hypothetical protein